VLVDRFYTKVKRDRVIGHFFTKAVDFSWEKHIPVMVAFWSGILLGENSYSGNPMQKHLELNKVFPIEKMHFERWLELWGETVRENFSGEKAEEAVSRAKSIAQLIHFKTGGIK
jgi:hemoglobin